jgi:glutaredoxin-related protein
MFIPIFKNQTGTYKGTKQLLSCVFAKSLMKILKKKSSATDFLLKPFSE